MRGKVRVGEAYSRAYRITPAYAGKSDSLYTHFVSLLGSPPPMRGKVQQFPDRFRFLGITPAYAGKSRALYAEAKNYEDHPRLCGEKPSIRPYPKSSLGSPPPMRGKAEPMQIVTDLIRITPAYAGKRCTPQSYQAICRDHPRLCGEKIKEEADRQGITGSPPPMRGKDEFANGGRSKSGITPAYAGKSVLGSSFITPCEDHPRLCGEKITK